VNWFLSLEDAEEKIEEFKHDYNGFRPHSALCSLPPNQVLEENLQDLLFLF
jgi:putative transposase